MGREYGALIDAQVEVGQYGGYQTSEDAKAEAAANARYEGALQTFVYDLLKDGTSADEAAALVNTDMEEIAAASNPEWHGTYDIVRHDILARIEREGGKKPWQRTLRRRAWLIILAVLVVAYGGTRWYNTTPVDQPPESKAGLIQRAAALHKVVRYQEYHPDKVRRGRWLVELVFWPIEPTENDIKGAGELGGFILGGGQSLMAGGAACNVPVSVSSQGDVDEATLALLEDVALYLQNPKTQWQEPAVATVLGRVQARHPCK